MSPQPTEIALLTEDSPSGRRAPLATAAVLPMDREWVAEHLARIALRTAPHVLEPEVATRWRMVLDEMLEPVAVGHRLCHIGSDAADGRTVTAVAQMDEARTDSWPLRGAAPVPRVEPGDVWSDFEAALVRDRFFLAHDVLEPLWRQSRSERAQTAIFVVAGLHQAARGRLVGAHKLFSKAYSHMQQLSGEDARLSSLLASWAGDPGAAAGGAPGSWVWTSLVHWARQ